MAKDTPASLRNMVLYEVYVRNHTVEGSFKGVEKDLERIHSMGVDIVWFMPIHPIGKVNKKGVLGCPYSISDYREVNPEYGTKEEFLHLIEKIHALNMKVMIDVVYNHTAHDSILVKEHPEYFHQDSHGIPMTTVQEWSDVIDLNHPQPGLTRYLIDTLIQWAEYGVDGFRCDVASLLPLEFWLQAREEAGKVRPGIIWLAESVHARFVSDRRKKDLIALSDGELYQAFDITYDYDIWPVLQAAMKGIVPLPRYIDLLQFQDAIYPANFIKLRFVENHDQRRIQAFVQDPQKAIAWTAFQVFNNGAFLLYAGQESAASKTPDLFDRDPIEWRNYELQDWFTRLIKIKKHPIVGQGTFLILADSPVIQAAWTCEEGSLLGIFNPMGVTTEFRIDIPDGDYVDMVSDKRIKIQGSTMPAPETFAIFLCDSPVPECCLKSGIMD